MLSRMDANDDKKLTKEEMVAIEDEMLTEETHIVVAMRADKNKDGTLTRGEFVHFKTGEESDLKEEL